MVGRDKEQEYSGQDLSAGFLKSGINNRTGRTYASYY
jgi:hypothetical protein